MKNFIATVGMALTVLIAGIALAGPATDALKTKQTELFEVIAQPETAERNAQLKSLFDQMLAYDVFAQDSLGEKWGTLSGAQKTQFKPRLAKLVRCNYARNLKKMLDYEIRYVGEQSKPRGTLVRTAGHHKTDLREPDIELDFLMRVIGGKQMTIDIYAERASLTKAYKSQFLPILRQADGFKKLIEKMDEKIEKNSCD